MNKKQKKAIYVQIIILSIILIIKCIVKTKAVNLIPECAFYKKYNIMCPGCGGTRFVTYLVDLKFIEAAKIHTVFFATVIYLIIFDIVYIYNSLFDKKVEFFKWWHAIVWGFAMIVYTVIRNNIGI